MSALGLLVGFIVVPVAGYWFISVTTKLSTMQRILRALVTLETERSERLSRLEETIYDKFCDEYDSDIDDNDNDINNNEVEEN